MLRSHMALGRDHGLGAIEVHANQNVELVVHHAPNPWRAPTLRPPPNIDTNFDAGDASVLIQHSGHRGPAVGRGVGNRRPSWPGSPAKLDAAPEYERPWPGT